MRYANVQTKLWCDEKFSGLSVDARLMFVYLLTSPHSNMIGYYWLPTAYLAHDLAVQPATVPAVLNELVREGMIRYDPGAQVVLIINYLRHNPIRGWKSQQGALIAASTTPRSHLLVEFIAGAKVHTGLDVWDGLLAGYQPPIEGAYKGLPDTPEAPPEPLPRSETETESETESEAETEAVIAVADAPRGRRPKKAPVDGAISEDARTLARALWHHLEERGALPAAKGWFMRQAGVAEHLLLKQHPLEDWLNALEWTKTDTFWSSRVNTLQALGAHVWPQYAQRRTGPEVPPVVSRAAAGLLAWMGQEGDK